jgi:deoxyribose-phosphate aldolase
MSHKKDLRSRINQYIDQTLLKPDATPQDIDQICQDACQYQFFAVCVNPHYVKRCSDNLAGTNIAVASTVGFPLGMATSQIKAAEAKEAIANGAVEIDMVINVGELKAGNDDYVESDIRAVVAAASPHAALVKVIIETGFLTDEEKERACKAAMRAGANFVKTSTGFGPGGATEKDVSLMLTAVKGSLSVKASGGIRSWETAQKMIEAGASRLGTSSGIAIVLGAQGDDTSPTEAVSSNY